MIDAGLRSLDIPLLYLDMFRQVTMSWTGDLVINFVNFLYDMEWQPYLTRSLIVCIYRSMNPMCSFADHVCRCAGDNNKKFSFIISVGGHPDICWSILDFIILLFHVPRSMPCFSLLCSGKCNHQPGC